LAIHGEPALGLGADEKMAAFFRDTNKSSNTPVVMVRMLELLS